MYRVQLSNQARKQLARLDAQLQSRITRELLQLAAEPRPNAARKLTVRQAWRLRVGDYRVVYEIHDAQLFVFVIRIGHRAEVYR